MIVLVIILHNNIIGYNLAIAGKHDSSCAALVPGRMLAMCNDAVAGCIGV